MDEAQTRVQAQEQPEELTFRQIRESQGIVAAGLIVFDAVRIALPQILDVVKPDLPKSPANAAVDAALSVIDAPDIGALATLGSWYAYAAASDPDELPYDLSFWRTCVSVVGCGLGTWLIGRGSKYAWPVLGVAGAISAAMGGMYTSLHDRYVTRTWKTNSLREALFNVVMPVAHGAFGVLGIAAITKTGEPLVNRAARHIPEAITTRWPSIRRLGLYYMVFSIVGHWVEMLFCLGIKHGIFQGEYDNGENKMLWDQWLFPFPAEGTAAVLMALILHPAKEVVHGHAHRLVSAGTLSKFVAAPLALIATFLLNQVVCTAIDYMTGMVANRDYSLWDYREMPFNFQGQICLQNSLFYTSIATWAAWWLFPRMEQGMALAGDTVLDGAFAGLGSLFLFLELLYHVIPPRESLPETTEDEPTADEPEATEEGSIP